MSEPADCQTTPSPEGLPRTQACMHGHRSERLLSFWRLRGSMPIMLPGARLGVTAQPLGKGAGHRPQGLDPGNSRKQPW